MARSELLLYTEFCEINYVVQFHGVSEKHSAILELSGLIITLYMPASKTLLFPFQKLPSQNTTFFLTYAK